ncbi:MAG: prenyltransferase/squalene oxidase repeat-containing protein [bacterium]
MRIESLLVSVFVVLSLSSVWAQEQTIDRGVAWLRENQDANGSWSSSLVTPFETTCVVADTLNYLGTTGASYSNTIGWVETQTVFSIRYLAQKIKSLAEYGSDTTMFVGTLTSSQNEDGGFGIDLGYESDILDTALSLFALKSANYSNTSVIQPALSYLLANQNTDGGFGLAGKLSLADDSAKKSNVYTTSLALLILTQYRKDYYLEEAISKASNWLISKQNPDGSFGTLWETALAYSPLSIVP